MSTRNQFSHKIVWDENGIGRAVIILNDNTENNTEQKENDKNK